MECQCVELQRNCLSSFKDALASWKEKTAADLKEVSDHKSLSNPIDLSIFNHSCVVHVAVAV